MITLTFADRRRTPDGVQGRIVADLVHRTFFTHFQDAPRSVIRSCHGRVILSNCPEIKTLEAHNVLFAERSTLQ
jgi:hypothetical protein